MDKGRFVIETHLRTGRPVGVTALTETPQSRSLKFPS